MTTRHRIVPWLCIAGFVLIVVSALSALTDLQSRYSTATPAKKRTGLLVAKDSEITWDGGSDEKQYKAHPTARFELINSGDTSVRVLKASSSCGCAAPRVQPLVIAPGGLCVVEVEAIPFPVGEKTATITLETDSHISPTVSLFLRMIGSRKPPFLLRAGGDLTFMETIAQGDARDILVVTIEREHDDRRPILKSTLPFFSIELVSQSEKPYTTNGTVSKEYRYKAIVTEVPKERSFTGEVLVTDPWDDSRIEHLTVHGDVSGPLKVAPRRLFVPWEVEMQSDWSAKLLVLSRDPLIVPIVHVRDSESSPIIVEHISTSDDKRSHTYQIALSRGRHLESGQHDILISHSAAMDDPIVATVVLQEAASQ